MHHLTGVVVGCIAIQFANSGYAVLLKQLDASFNTVVFSLYRDVLCLPVLAITSYVFEENFRQFPNTMNDIGIFTLLGTQAFLFQILFIVGVQISTPTTASMWAASIPVVTAVLAVLVGIEPMPDHRSTEGIVKMLAVCFTGAGALVMSESSDAVGGLTGNLLLFGYVLAVCSNFVSQKRFIYSIPNSKWRSFPVKVVLFQYMFASILIFITAVVGKTFNIQALQFQGEKNSFYLPSKAFVPLFYSVFITSALVGTFPIHHPLLVRVCSNAFLGTWWSVVTKYAPASFVASFKPLGVPITLVLSLLAGLDAPVSWSKMIGFTLILCGLFPLCYVEYRNSCETQLLNETTEERLLG